MGQNNTIDKFTITSTANATDFGDMINGQPGSTGNRYPSCTDNGTNERGVAIGGGDSSANMIQYVTINSTGNATDFGDLINGYSTNASGALSNSTNERGVVGGGVGTVNTIQYITINSTGNATDFGDLTIARNGLYSACSNGTGERGIFCSGNPAGAPRTRMDYITINSTGNATVFGAMRHELIYAGGYSDCGT